MKFSGDEAFLSSSVQDELTNNWRDREEIQVKEIKTEII